MLMMVWLIIFAGRQFSGAKISEIADSVFYRVWGFYGKTITNPLERAKKLNKVHFMFRKNVPIPTQRALLVVYASVNLYPVAGNKLNHFPRPGHFVYGRNEINTFMHIITSQGNWFHFHNTKSTIVLMAERSTGWCILQFTELNEFMTVYGHCRVVYYQ